ncbi:hypothetical protein KY290_000729 [Solanum tuberosum]|uniref:Uncharacterized protein n=1 Tax=Solanum tuberosum TaxID=4113 RepID=A0ABQ7WK54_SOLTU|nr:hypothetical protein KY290_000729 [Solanum tuberosum]
MTPTPEEIVSFMRKGTNIRGANLRNKRPIILKNIDAKKFLDLLKINQIEKESLKNRGHRGWKVNGCFVFMVAILGLIVFPKWDKHIDIRLDGVVKAWTTMESPTIIPMILADMFPKDVICMSIDISFLVLIALRGVQPYSPLQVMCQLDKVQEVIPPNDDMSRFVFDTPLGFAFDSQDILKIWFGSIISEQSEMVVEIQLKKKRPAHHKTVGKRVGEGQRHHSPTRSSSPYRKKSPIGVTRCGGGIEAYRGEISSIRGGAG